MGIAIGEGISIGAGISVDAGVFLTTSSAQNYAANGATMATFRVLNRGGNWDEFYAGWTNGTWSCVQIPGSVVVNVTIPNPGEPDSIDITITGGTFVLNSFYSFQGYQ
jgi:tetrahydrodipicolinate N-succinyltransferase